LLWNAPYISGKGKGLQLVGSCLSSPNQLGICGKKVIAVIFLIEKDLQFY